MIFFQNNTAFLAATLILYCQYISFSNSRMWAEEWISNLHGHPISVITQNYYKEKLMIILIICFCDVDFCIIWFMAVDF